MMFTSERGATTITLRGSRPARYSLTRSLASVPWKWEVEVLLDLPVDEAARRIPATLAEIVDDADGTLLRMRVDSLDWMATVLAELGCGFTVRRPDELRTSIRALATHLAAQVG